MNICHCGFDPELHVIGGGMKCGKTFHLTAIFAPLAVADISYGLYKPVINVRENGIKSRAANELPAKPIRSLCSIIDDHLAHAYQIVGIDEIHMFDPKDVFAVEWLLENGVNVTVAGLKTDYRGVMYEIMVRLVELGATFIEPPPAVCEICKKQKARFTQVFKNNVPILEGLPSVIPEDGTYIYKAVCREHFVRHRPWQP